MCPEKPLLAGRRSRPETGVILVKECGGFGACRAEGFLLAPRWFHSPRAFILAHHLSAWLRKGLRGGQVVVHVPHCGGGVLEKKSRVCSTASGEARQKLTFWKRVTSAESDSPLLTSHVTGTAVTVVFTTMLEKCVYRNTCLLYR